MLIRFNKENGEYVYINPYWVFGVFKWDDKHAAIWSYDERNYVVVNEPLDQVAMRLNDAMRR